MLPQTLQQIHKSLEKSGIPIDKLEHILNEMGRKGSIYLARGKESNYYFNAQLAIGMYEHQVNRLTKEFIADTRQYFDEAFSKELFRTGSAQLRVIPIEKSITPDYKVTPYEDLKLIIQELKGPISVANCICRQANDLLGQPCKHTSLRESCFLFGSAARMYVDEGRGRYVTKEEALEIMQKAQDDGLVLEILNAVKPSGMCTCCGDCCGYLTNIKKLPRPAEFLPSSYYVQADSESCTGCETCVNACPMGARSIRNDVSVVDTDRCIGCGLCVPACPSGVNKLIKKEKTVVPAKDVMAMYMQILDNKLRTKKAAEHH
jgi:ferredoxin